MLVGLGNPGRKYERTRHNVGFMIIDNLAQEVQCGFGLERNSSIGKIQKDGRNLRLAKPLTYMNRSGEAVRDIVQKYQIPLSNLLVILDDLNLPFGKLRFRRKGSDGGHNGLASVIYQLRSEEFPRLRVGIGAETRLDAVSFVLSKFDKKERGELPDIIKHATEACLSFVTEGIEKSMTRYN